MHAFVDEKRLVQHGLRNYWGYNSIGFFAPEMRYSATGTSRRIQDPGEDAARGGHRGDPRRGLQPHRAKATTPGRRSPSAASTTRSTTASIRTNPRRYLNFTGTGNSFNSAHRVVLALIMDSLRYWVEEMHVDGFRFDLATTLARNAAHAYDRNGAFLARGAPGPGARRRSS